MAPPLGPSRREVLAQLAALAALPLVPARSMFAASDPLAGTVAEYQAGRRARKWTAAEVVASALGRCAQQACRDKGVRVGCFRPPSVPLEQSCLRLAARADLTPSDVERADDVVLAAVAG